MSICLSHSIVNIHAEINYQHQEDIGKIPTYKNVCELSPDPGPCDQNLTRWYHDIQTGKCKTFIYGGCDGNANNYQTKSLCEETCGSICFLPEDYGPCDGICQAYRYNATIGDCELFEYGCCPGNANTFLEYNDCMRHCADICDMPMDIGLCDAAFLRYYFNKDTGICEQFNWGGCGGNDNNFISLEECEAACTCQIDFVDDQLYTQQMLRSKSASQTLTSYSKLIDNSSVLYSATQFILLQAEFKVETGSTLDILLDGCID